MRLDEGRMRPPNATGATRADMIMVANMAARIAYRASF